MLRFAFGPLIVFSLIPTHSLADDSALLRACEETVSAFLKAPSTYVRIDTHQSDEGTAILLDFDAQNESGVPLRHTVKCSPNDHPESPSKFQVLLDDRSFVVWHMKNKGENTALR